jgi:hypothetical protein
MIQMVELCIMIVLVYPLMEGYWLQPMVRCCSGYVLKLERFWTQLTEPMMVCFWFHFCDFILVCFSAEWLKM